MFDCVKIVLWSVVIVPVMSNDLVDRKGCGSTICSQYEFCREAEQSCVGCTVICDISSGDYQAEICERLCQDYVHDYVRGYVTRDYLRKEFAMYNRNIECMLFVIITLLIVLVVLNGGVHFSKWYRLFKRKRLQKFHEKKLLQQKLASVQYSTSGVNNNNTISRDDGARCTIQSIPTIPLRGSLPSVATLTTQADSVYNTFQLNVDKTLPLSTEEPCEDVMEYRAYVNQVMPQISNNEDMDSCNYNSRF